MGALNGLDACPFELVSKSPKLRFWLNVLKILKKIDHIISIRTFPFGFSTPIRIFEMKDFHIRAASTKAHFGLNYYLMSFSPNRKNQFFSFFARYNFL